MWECQEMLRVAMRLQSQVPLTNKMLASRNARHAGLFRLHAERLDRLRRFQLDIRRGMHTPDWDQDDESLGLTCELQRAR
eukprot:NODE_7122_length_472_cov_36.482270_g6305_i0.p4 GENE.NODE_7122_length_472_cov_36.482270_g6305_i0~~NODE_7122_length_472_cov_36.482270_g6305_i0.p4  ORF type:complete len:94 (-),score=39.65 NODE_7122_length_472_cov_36.482270_g6305_i0:191-430(-)